MAPKDSDREWEKLGQTDPYYGVVSLDKFRRANLGPEALRDFFKTGEEHVAYLAATFQATTGLAFKPRRALDFGCGVGRIAIPLARACESVTGVDVSKAMLEEATRKATELGLRNIELELSDDELTRLKARFDFIHAFLVFQHIRRKRGEKIMDRLLGLLEPDGIGVFQVIYDREAPWPIRAAGFLRRTFPLVNRLANLFYGKPASEPLMEKNVYDLNRIMKLLQRNGCGNVNLRFHGRGSMRSAMIFFRKTPDQIPYDTCDDTGLSF